MRSRSSWVDRAVAVVDALVGAIFVGAGRREIKLRQIPETDAVGWATVGLAPASTSADANSLFICTMIQHRSGVFEQGDQNGACRSAVSGAPARPALVGPCGTAHPIPPAREKSRTAL